MNDSTRSNPSELVAASTPAPPKVKPLRAQATWHFGRFALLRGLGISLVFMFLALWDQGLALIGSDGLTPVVDTFDTLWGRHGGGAVWRYPSLFWLVSEDWFIRGVAAMGAVAAGLLTIGVLPRWMCVVCFVSLHSFGTSDGAEAFWFYWPFDQLVTETTFLAIFLAPPGVWPKLTSEPAVPRLARYLVYWVVFRLLFGPGITKIHAGQVQWMDLTVMRYFLETMPHPTAEAAWMLEQPMWIVDGMTVFTLLMELVLIWGLFVPGWPRLLCAISGIALMAGIQLAGSFRGFNIVTIGLFLLLVRDSTWLRMVPGRLRARWTELREAAASRQPVRGAVSKAWGWLGAAGTLVLLLATVHPVMKQTWPGSEAHTPKVLKSLSAEANHLRLAGAYAMFHVVPLQRRVIVWQGSADGEQWVDYQPLGIPARPDYRPRRYAPYHDYLGFLMWVCAFVPPQFSQRWMIPLQAKLLEHEPETLSLFVDDPFEQDGPRFVRARVFIYSFADAEQRAAGVWWEREFVEPFLAARERSPG